jgi:hypothetical protein
MAALVPAVAEAHHGTFLFDASRDVTVAGTVKDFQWTNPHSFILLVTEDAKGGEQQTEFEGESPASLIREGLKPTSFKPGDHVVLVAHPRTDGQPGGMFIKVTLASAAGR